MANRTTIYHNISTDLFPEDSITPVSGNPLPFGLE
jgi:hypothetical protein